MTMVFHGFSFLLLVPSLEKVLPVHAILSSQFI